MPDFYGGTQTETNKLQKVKDEDDTNAVIYKIHFYILITLSLSRLLQLPRTNCNIYLMYKIFSFLFFTSISVTIIYMFAGKDLPIGPFIIINAFIYLGFIIYVIFKTFFKAKYSLHQFKPIKKMFTKTKSSNLLTFLTSSLSLLFILSILVTVMFIFSLFVFPIFRDTALDILEPVQNTSFNSNLSKIRSDITLLKYDTKDLKQKLYFSENPKSYRYEDDEYEYELRLDTNKLFEYGRTDDYYYNLTISSKESGLTIVGWQSGGVYLHKSPAVSIASDVESIQGDYKNFDYLNEKPVFVITVVDDGNENIYVVYPEETEYSSDYIKVLNFENIPSDEFNEHGFRDSMIAKISGYEFLEDQEKIRLYFKETVWSYSSMLITFNKDQTGHAVPIRKLEKTSN